MWEDLGRALFLAGMGIAAICQLAIVVSAFRTRWLQGVLCLLVPAYILFYARRPETRGSRKLPAWAIEMGLTLAGVLALTGWRLSARQGSPLKASCGPG